MNISSRCSRMVKLKLIVLLAVSLSVTSIATPKSAMAFRSFLGMSVDDSATAFGNLVVRNRSAAEQAYKAMQTQAPKGSTFAKTPFRTFIRGIRGVLGENSVGRQLITDILAQQSAILATHPSLREDITKVLDPKAPTGTLNKLVTSLSRYKGTPTLASSSAGASSATTRIQVDTQTLYETLQRSLRRFNQRDRAEISTLLNQALRAETRVASRLNLKVADQGLINCITQPKWSPESVKNALRVIIAAGPAQSNQDFIGRISAKAVYLDLTSDAEARQFLCEVSGQGTVDSCNILNYRDGLAQAGLGCD